jgi:hypothetical protein
MKLTLEEIIEALKCAGEGTSNYVKPDLLGNFLNQLISQKMTLISDGNLVAQAKLIRKCAKSASKMGDAASGTLAKGHNADAAVQLDTADEIRDAILANLTPAMLQAEEEEKNITK